MACISCGLRVESTGRGTIDIDPEGGLHCNGVGAESDDNETGRGMRIKENPTVDNSLIIDTNGLYAPRASNFRTLAADALYGAVSDPNYTGGGVAYTSPTVSIVATNPSTVNTLRYVWQASLEWTVTDQVAAFWLELHTQVAGGGWETRGSALGSNVFSPMLSRALVLDVGPEKSYTIDARVIVYTGNIGLHRVGLTAWGDWTGGTGVL